MKKLNILLAMSIIFISYSSLAAQEDYSSYYPLNEGDTWYYTYSTNDYFAEIDLIVEVLNDTIMPNGIQYKKIKYTEYPPAGSHSFYDYRRLVDNRYVYTFMQYLGPMAGGETLKYDLGAPDSSYWIYYTPAGATFPNIFFGLFKTEQYKKISDGLFRHSKYFKNVLVDKLDSITTLNWIDSGEPTEIVEGIGIIYGAEHGGRLIEALISNQHYQLITDMNAENSPSNFKLFQNYPNPFNPATTIKYSIPKSGHVELKIYDVLGCAVTSLVNEYQKQGNYEVIFNGSRLASGVYFCNLTAGEYSSNMKMVLIK